jgi:type IV secretion system protein VirD4
MNEESHNYERYVSTGNKSRWADSEELKNAKTVKRINVDDDECDGCGLPIISDGRTTYVDDSDTNSLFLGSTGSKKTRLFAMPLINIFALNGESFIATDPKGELYQKTSGIVAAKEYNVIVLDFRDPTKSSCWNPLMLPYNLYHSEKKDEAISMLNDFINFLAGAQKRGSKDPYFIELGCSMALANLLFFIETATEKEANIYNFANFYSTKSSPDATEELSQCVAEGSIASVNYKGVLSNKDAKSTFGNVAACVSTMVNPFVIRKTLCQILSTSSFDIRNFGKEKTAVYIILPDEKTTLHFLVTAFIKQAYEALIYEAQQQESKKLPVRLNFLLDEFGNIPTIPDMPAMITAARSRNMRFFLMAQGMHQLLNKYGEDANTIKGNCDNWVFLTSREHGLLSEISNLCGEILYSDFSGKMELHPLISISELQRLKKEKGEALILHGRHYPFVTQLPDVDEYAFKIYPPVVVKKMQLPKITIYNADKVISEIKENKRPVPFSKEAFGHLTFYGKGKERNNIFDW